MPSRPEREQARSGGEIVGQGEQLLGDLADGQQEKHRPEQRREIRHDARRHDRAVPRTNAVAEQQTQVLEIALTPSPVTLELVQKGRRRLLVAAVQIRRDPDFPPGTSHQRTFDEVMAQEFAAERWASRQTSEPAMPHEGLEPKDGVVTPVVALAELPEAKTCREHRAVRAACELLHPREQRLATDHPRDRLHDSGLRVVIHQPYETNEGRARHDAIGVKPDYVRVVPAPAPQEVRDVIALSLDVVSPMPVEQSAEAVDGAARVRPGDLFRDLLFRISGVTQDVEVEVIEVTRGGERAIRRLDARKDPADVLIANRDDDRRP